MYTYIEVYNVLKLIQPILSTIVIKVQKKSKINKNKSKLSIIFIID